MFARSVGKNVLNRSSVFKRTKVTLPKLEWDFAALEPFISGKINELHYSKHHQTYVNGFNTATEQMQELQLQLSKQPENLSIASKIIGVQQNIKFHGGGFKNHCLFWANLSPQSAVGGQPPTGALAAQIEKQYGSLENLVKISNDKLLGIQGSGWIFIVKNVANGGTIDVVQTYNQDTITDGNIIPLVAVDAWEHAYYLQYENRKGEYFNAIWNVINWEEAGRRYDSA
ncbi:hypothetical protein Kpol_1004p63 [Vanderwaltozyma polyspora DSM 70294]|uniref:Superoxide dismutase n=1 Tax=Vanderwaltozyma polyspora (strain ATCC 22028 / DSM 70294 / BCRC 21397 / CBS 2163 / NBRC 10782 / NRRL Y-8283 / UCD 57-17) TaxID=436907 RepID=A7TJB7_VANPO|nr:uncharacterized protein Kpol_1004p63 [Vanderwaltozyma polyspora DSM 70294]EDO17686.1 hypothetical protein Kpol_1004p63 [Vanderwaltozyma polyspora DSM 70294]